MAWAKLSRARFMRPPSSCSKNSGLEIKVVGLGLSVVRLRRGAFSSPRNLTLSLSTMAEVISSWMAKMSSNVPVELLRPEMVAVNDIEELGRDAELVLDLADAAFDDRGHAQPASDLADVHVAELGREGRALAATSSSGILAREVMISSARPSQK